MTERRFPIEQRRRLAVYAGIGLVSAAVLVFEIVLTRVFAVTQFYHFAFVTVGLALLGFGASGSVLAAFPALGRGGPRRWSLLALGQSVATVVAYAGTNLLPFDSYSIAWDGRQIIYLIVFYLLLGVPFFFGGAVVGVLLSGWDQVFPIPSHRIYAANLAGSGLGCLVALGVLPLVGGVGAVLVAAACAATAALVMTWAESRRSVLRRSLLLAVIALLVAWTWGPPGFLELRLSPYKELSGVLRFPDADVISTRWTADTRVDHVRSYSIRSLPGLSYTFEGVPPSQDGLTFDGDDLSPVPLVAPNQAQFASSLMMSLPFSLRPEGDMLVLGSRGGLDVLTALRAGADSVIAAEPNGPAVEIATEAGTAYRDSRVQVVAEEPRTYVERSRRQFDVIDLALTSPYRPVTSGAYSLAEDYSLTVEAVRAYLDRLRPGGVLAVMRWLQTPPSEEIRLIALAAEAVRQTGGEPRRSVVGLRGYSTALVLVQPDGWNDADLSAVRATARELRFDLMAAPELSAQEANRYNLVPEDQYFTLAGAILSGEGQLASAFDLSAPTDDHPFFGHFFTWSQAPEVWSALGTSWQPFGGAGYFVLVAFLLLSVLAAVLLIVVPLLVRRRDGDSGRSVAIRGWSIGYFALLGIGFLFVELPIFQQYILLLGRPTTSLAVVLSVLLVASGAGSHFSQKIGWRAGGATLTVLVAVLPVVVRVTSAAILATPLAVRILVAGLILAPVGFLMGIMFPKGLALLHERSPRLVPWAWGINGAASVISSAAAALLALSFGFSAVIGLGAVCYGACTLLARPG